MYERKTSNQNYYLHWEVTATGPDGHSLSYSGNRAAQSRYGRQTDTNMYYLDAQITDTLITNVIVRQKAGAYFCRKMNSG